MQPGTLLRQSCSSRGKRASSTVHPVLVVSKFKANLIAKEVCPASVRLVDLTRLCNTVLDICSASRSRVPLQHEIHPSLPSTLTLFGFQTPLHYAYSYGFESFGEYLISKGADDSIVNADGLTCYEGLNQDNLGQL